MSNIAKFKTNAPKPRAKNKNRGFQFIANGAGKRRTSAKARAKLHYEQMNNSMTYGGPDCG